MQTALISVSDKSGLAQLAAGLQKAGIRLIASAGSAKYLRELGYQATSTDSITGFTELLGGRVKTLHPRLHAGILARADDAAELQAQGISSIDIVIVNLYPFAQAIAKPHQFEQALENIDIGGVALLRAAAKNHPRVSVICDPDDYPDIVAAVNGDADWPTQRRNWAAKAFAHCAHYDSLISNYLNQSKQEASPDKELQLNYTLQQELRYGENPQQSAGWYLKQPGDACGLAACQQIQGKQLSYNNLLDADLAANCAAEFNAPAWVIVKHLSPCAVASAERQYQALQRAWQADSESAFGSILACNRELDADSASFLAERFVEVVIAPAVSNKARQILKNKNNLRLLIGQWRRDQEQIYRSITGGLLAQSANDGDLLGENWRVASQRQPTQQQMQELLFAFRVCKNLRSNAIAISQDSCTLGLGVGQSSRLRSLQQALLLASAHQYEPEKAVVASDAFFPFADSLEYACKSGLRCFIAPGGSVRDAEVIDVADKYGAVLVFSAKRHFLH